MPSHLSLPTSAFEPSTSLAGIPTQHLEIIFHFPNELHTMDPNVAKKSRPSIIDNIDGNTLKDRIGNITASSSPLSKPSVSWRRLT